MTSLAAEAEAARVVAETAEQAAAEEHRRLIVAEAREALKGVLTRPDGTVITFSDVGLKLRSAEVDDGPVVWSDGTVTLAATRREDGWAVHLVEQVDGVWTRASDRLASLADLGEALAS